MYFKSFTMENNRSRAPLGDKTNTSRQVDDKERKRERDRARWHAMSLEKKTTINKRRRESYHKRKQQHVTGSTDYDAASNNENIEPVETHDWLHRNDSYQTYTLVDENMSTQLSYEQEMETKRKGKESTTDVTDTSTTYVDKTCVKSTSRSTYFSERYKNMTPAQREARREYQRLYNSTPNRKKALKKSIKKYKEMQKQTLHPQSIAMENPLYILESSSTPSHISIPNEEIGDDGLNDILSTHRAHVPCGQRHALLTCRNTKFERRIGANTKASNNDGDYMIED